MDYIARFENLKREMNLISNIIGLRGELPKLNKSSSKNMNFIGPKQQTK